MKRASLTARLRVLEAAQASTRAGVFGWQGGQWAALTPGASLPAGVPSLPDLVEGMGEAGNAGPYAGPGVLFTDGKTVQKVIAGISWGDL